MAGSNINNGGNSGRGPQSRTSTLSNFPDTTLSPKQTLPISTTPLCALSHRLRLAESITIADSKCRPAMVEFQARGTWHTHGCKCVVVGDTKFTPPEISIIPGVLPSLTDKFSISIMCVHPPIVLPKGQIIAQVIPIFEQCEREPHETSSPLFNVNWCQTLSHEKPWLTCRLSKNGQSTRVTGMLDTGADVTIIPAREWPSQWELQSAAGRIQGVGGFQLAKQSKSVVQIMGPNGQLASVRPFVLDYAEPLWGRDVLAQWGATINLPKAPQIFQ